MSLLPRGCHATNAPPTTTVEQQRHDLLSKIHVAPEQAPWTADVPTPSFVAPWTCARCNKQVTTVQTIRATVPCFCESVQHAPARYQTTFALVPLVEFQQLRLDVVRVRFTREYPSLHDLLKQPSVQIKNLAGAVVTLNLAEAYVRELHATTGTGAQYDLRGHVQTYLPNDARYWHLTSDDEEVVGDHVFAANLDSHGDAYIPQASAGSLVRFVPFAVFVFK